MLSIFVTGRARFKCGMQSFSVARATAASHRRSRLPWPRLPARARQTTTGDRSVAAALSTSVIAGVGCHLAAEDPIGPSGVAEDQRYQDRHSDQHENLTVLRGGCLPDGDAL